MGAEIDSDNDDEETERLLKMVLRRFRNIFEGMDVLEVADVMQESRGARSGRGFKNPVEPELPREGREASFI